MNSDSHRFVSLQAQNPNSDKQLKQNISTFHQMGSTKDSIFVDGALIIGAGPSGLAAAACLKENGVPSLLLERSDCVASLWQHKTYDRLKLHLPKQFCQLPLMNFPDFYPKYPNKAQFVAYLESYAKLFSIEPKFGKTVVKTDFESGLWKVKTQDECEYVSKWLIVATGENADPANPEIPGIESFTGQIIHTIDYRSGTEFENKKVLVIGCGNSGMEVSFDLAKHNVDTHMVVRNSVHVLPKEMFGISMFTMSMGLLKWLPMKLVDKFVLLITYFIFGDTDRLGIRRPKTGPFELKKITGKTPVLDVGALSEIRSGRIKVVEGVREITKNGAKFVDGQEREYDTIVLATGYKSNVPGWLKGTDFFTKDGMPKKINGWKGDNGLYAAGFSKRGLLGASMDAVNIAKDIADQLNGKQ